jgi:hypothetical protein
MARLNDGLAMFDAILIVPMLQIVWTFFSIFTGFIYFEEYRVCESVLFLHFMRPRFHVLIHNYFLFCRIHYVRDSKEQRKIGI